MFNSEELEKKWAPILESADAPPFADNHRKAVTAVMLENQEKALAEARGQAQYLSEETPSNVVSGTDNWDPVLISLVRRAMPSLIAYDVCGVQPMSGPTGLIFAMKSRYNGVDATPVDTTDAEALFNAPTQFAPPVATSVGEGDITKDMGFTIEKVVVEAKTRALKAEYSMELAQDLKAIHGLDAEAELANILSTEILAEINREVIDSINTAAVQGFQNDAGGVDGVFDLDVDADGRWAVEKFKSLLFQLELESNEIAKGTRRGKGNYVICSSNVASALAAAGVLDYAPAIAANLNVDTTGNTFAGLINGRIKVYVDPYALEDYATVGYKGANSYDAGIYYCPYVPLTMVRAVDENSFQPKIGFKTRYGLAANPMAHDAVDGPTSKAANTANNPYFRKFTVTNINGTAPVV
jgi:hypothetical protein